MRTLALMAVLALAVSIAGCSHDGPQMLAEATTRAAYANDLNGTVAHFDPALKAQVTRATVGELSDALNALGTLHGFTAVGSTPAQGRYDYQASFERGRMLVQLRLDPDQQIAAYRVTPLAPQ
jgi:predicted small lipoprotein YifL